VAVYNGNILVLINVDDSAAVPLHSDGLYLSDGRVHQVLLDFTQTRYNRFRNINSLVSLVQEKIYVILL